jgi:hypothetical protein
MEINGYGLTDSRARLLARARLRAYRYDEDPNDDPAIKWWWPLAMIAGAGGWVWFCIWAVSRVGT